MREHIGLYRGKRTDNGEWVQGFYCTNPEWDRKIYGKHHWIISRENGIQYEVDPDTVGECCGGLTDKNGKLIFEGDIINRYTLRGTNDQRGAVVSWDSLFNGWYAGHCRSMYGGLNEIYEVIDNIHDNPELLGGGDNG